MLNKNPEIMDRLDSLFISTMKRADKLTDPIHHMAKKLERGTIKIEKVWSQGNYGYALVYYTNNTDKTFDRIIIKCTALDSNGQKINSNRRSFFAHEHGPIHPDFEGRIKVPVELFDMKLKSMTCEFMYQ
jgi:hypothetical protein